MIILDLILLVGIVYLLAQVRALGERLARTESKLASLQQAPLPSAERVLEDRSAEPRVLVAERSPPAPAAPVRETMAGFFERFVGGRLLIWVGGIALAAGGIFLIRHSIELVTPEARMIAAALLGLVLIGAGEYARAGRFFADDPRIGQSLVGAGIAILYAAVYGSFLLFELIGSGTASALMVLITAGALGLSLRHGAPTAAMGLVGGFATPLLVGDPDAGAIPVLAYLALLDVAIFAIAWRRGWPWLAAAAVLLSFAWSGYFVLEPPRDALPAGLFAALLGIAASLPKAREGRPVSLLQPAIIALAELAILVGRDDIGTPAWLLFGALATASLPLAVLRPEQRLAPAAALALALLLLTFKGAFIDDPLLPTAAAITTLLFFVGSLPQARRALLPALTASAALAGPLLIMREVSTELLPPSLWGALAAALAIAAFALWTLLRRGPSEGGGSQVGAFAAVATGTLLIAVAGHDLAPREAVSAVWLIAAVALLLAGVRMGDKALRLAGLLLLTVTTLKVFLIDAAALEGVLRILSFVALGLALIGIGKLYTKVLSAQSKAGEAPARRPAENS